MAGGVAGAAGDGDMAGAAGRVIVALDLPEGEALALADMLPRGAWLKVGMTLFYAAGPRIVTELKARGFHVFLDLKLHDIPHQVREASAVLGELGADLLTVHGAGGADMVAAAREGLTRVGAPTKILAVTVLTSMDAAGLEQIGVGRALPDQVRELARASYAAGADGVICSPLEAGNLRGVLGPEALIVTPGVRPAGADIGDQSRVATPGAAVKDGASHVVVGRPITQAADPAAAFEAIAADIRGNNAH
ncbi:orotidine-5'-phosphate decarboxylase [Trueperella bernardiae]|uniref:orotidine-5'-phosphate decarboxylase n=1 Tax=Trueperella bernardiae TaxID=59561 RepID=UPI00211B8267|nr:orotidine-5'-phosphate decarboxylase [Trueperella bernardiae]